MARSCTSCQNVKRPEIDRRLASGEPVAQVARDYDLNPSSLHRHKTNCLKLASSNQIMKDAARGSAAVALLPSKETLSSGYFELRTRIDQIVEQAQQEGSLNVAISGLNSIRQTLDSLARLGGAPPTRWDAGECCRANQRQCWGDRDRRTAHSKVRPSTATQSANRASLVGGRS
jgi:hypothetical protein